MVDGPFSKSRNCAVSCEASESRNSEVASEGSQLRPLGSTQKNLRFLKKLFRLLILILYLPIFIQRRVVESDFLSVRDSLFEESRDPSLKRFFIFVFCNQEKFS